MALDIAKGKSLNVFALVMINIIAVDSLRTLPLSAKYGFSLVSYYLLAGIIFFVPVALVAAELATGWPETGGIYVWVREAFGKRIAFITIWLQWIYNVVWYPTILAFIASAIAYLIHPTLVKNKIYLFLCIQSIFWLATIVNFYGMKVSSFISMLGAIFGTLIPILFIIALALYWIKSGKPIAIQFSMAHFMPKHKSLNDLVLFSGILFGLVGMEMSAVHASDVKNPQKDYPKALFYSTIIIFATLVLGSLAVAMVVPKNQLSLVTGLIDAFKIFFHSYGLDSLMPLVICMMILGGIAGIATWIIGPTKGLMIAARDDCLPHFLVKQNRYGVPVVILMLQGAIFSVLSTVFILFDSISESYWLLSELAAQLAMLVYVFMFLAVIKLRLFKPHIKRPFRIWGPDWVAITIATVGLTTCIATIFIGFLPPSQIHINNIYVYDLFLIIGMILFVLSPFFIANYEIEHASHHD